MRGSVVSTVQPISRVIDRIKKDLANDKGVVLLVLVVGLLVVAGAFIVTKLAMNASNTLGRTQTTAAKAARINGAVLAYFQGAGGFTGNVHSLPCPDADLDGVGDPQTQAACASPSGTIPYKTLGLGSEDVIDGYGTYYTYAVTQTARELCRVVTNDYNPAVAPEYTGTAFTPTDTEVRLSSQSAGAGSRFYYAIISHGPNRLGGISSLGNGLSGPNNAAERQNCPATNSANCTDPEALAIHSGPPSTADANYFDDQVFLGSSSELRKICERLTPGGRLNASINEPFTAAQLGGVPSSFAVTSGAVEVALANGSTTDYVLRFTGSGVGVQTLYNNFNPAELPFHISFEWRPTAPSGTNQAGISVATRASFLSIGATPDIFDAGDADGLTFRFFENTAGNANGTTPNRIYICDNTTAACNSGSRLAASADTFTISDDQAYTVELYDDGVMLWARITQINLPTNTATVSLATIATEAQKDFVLDNSLIFLNFANSTAELDDLLVARGVTAASFDGIDDIATANTADAHDTDTGDLTLEAWVRPDTYTGSDAVIMAKWTAGGMPAVQAYRLYLDGDGDLTLDLAGDDLPVANNVITRTYALGIRPTRDVWSHVAVSFDRTARRIVSYLDGNAVASQSADAFDANGVQDDGAADFAVGAQLPSADSPFDGDIADVRVWNTARTATQIAANYNARLQLSGSLAGLVANWTFDRDSNATFGATAVGFNAASSADVAGTLGGTLGGAATYIATIQQHLMPISETFCPNGTVVGVYRCDFRLTTQNGTLTIPSNLGSIFVKAWGAGGGGYPNHAVSSGGGGGFSQGRLLAIDTQVIPGATISVAVGAGGIASANDNEGGGGGGASGVWLDAVSDRAGIIAGGGGGASFGDDSDLTTFLHPDCSVVDRCGPGGGGGGPFNATMLTRDQTSRASDEPGGVCGGRGGDNSPSGDDPPRLLPTPFCAGGGADPVFIAGGTGGGAATGGISPVGSGGNGYSSTASFIGGGGGGGGVNTATFSSGGGEAGGFHTGLIVGGGDVTFATGWGGGGGSGFADVAGTRGVSGSAGGIGSAGGEFDPEYAGINDNDLDGDFTIDGQDFCVGGNCVSNPGRGGELPDVDGRPGAVILKW